MNITEGFIIIIQQQISKQLQYYKKYKNKSKYNRRIYHHYTKTNFNRVKSL
jgi:hypothetical protein